jgi:hypothetical protein
MGDFLSPSVLTGPEERGAAAGAGSVKAAATAGSGSAAVVSTAQASSSPPSSSAPPLPQACSGSVSSLYHRGQYIGIGIDQEP